MDETPMPPKPARRGVRRYLVLVTATAATCLLGVALAAAGMFGVQDWLRPPYGDYGRLKPDVGEAAPDFALKDINGEEFRLRSRANRLPVVVEFGSTTCPYCVNSAEGMEDLARKYSGKAHFLFVYGREAHPDQPGMMLPGRREEAPVLSETSTWEERAGRARSYCSARQPTARVLIDMDGPDNLHDRYNAGANSVVVIDGGGRVALRQALARPDELDECLKGLLSAP